MSKEDLKDAPLLNGWRYHPRHDGLGLAGTVTGHPRLPNGAEAVTSIIVEMNEADGWVQTRNRVYRLGRPAHVVEH